MPPFVSPELWAPVGVDALETAAERVVRSSKNTLVVAGPGAGKTELLAQRACYLLETGVCKPPCRILAISFKRDAAKNLQERVQLRCGDRARRFDSFTLDAFAKSLVDRFYQALPDGWRPTHGYEVMTKSMRTEEKREWLSTATVSKSQSVINNIKGKSDFQIDRLFDRMAHGQVLPYPPDPQNELERYFGLRWWRERLDQPAGNPSLTFPMLNRLAAFLLRCNPKLRFALQSTYSFVFLDEFQDTTTAQYDLVKASFSGSCAVMTAVGDGKQRIMLWAGAMHNVFEIFKGNFNAEYVHLVSNYRSAPELVQMQHVIAQVFEEDPPVAVAAKKGFSGSCKLIEFSNPEDEAEYLAELIERGIHSEGRSPRDFCILVRQLPGKMIQQLKPMLASRDIKLRDESLLQDLLAEPVVKFLLSVLRLATRPRDPDAWEVLSDEIGSLLCLGEDEEKIFIEQEAHRLLQYARGKIGASESLDLLPQQLIDMVGDTRFRSAYRQYSTGSYLKKTVADFAEALSDSAKISASARETVDDVLGLNVVPAMTIHKSKGLEFHTIIFMGLEDSQWWNFARQADEEKRGFFVAFSRAIERVFFTFSDVRDERWGRKLQNRGQIRDLYTILQQAEVTAEDCRQKE